MCGLYHPQSTFVCTTSPFAAADVISGDMRLLQYTLDVDKFCVHRVINGKKRDEN